MTDCTYGVAGDGDISVAIEAADDFTLSGTADWNTMTLTDEDTKVLKLRRRT